MQDNTSNGSNDHKRDGGISTQNSNQNTYTIRKGQELRIAVGPKEKAVLKLTKGEAEIFGSEMNSNKEYVVVHKNLAVFSWGDHAEVSIQGELSEEPYIGDKTTMDEMMKIHNLVEKERGFVEKAIANGNNSVLGPRVIVVAPVDSGKSSLCKLLCSYGTRIGRRVAFVDLDVGQGDITFPGCISAVELNEPISIENGLSFHSPLSFFYGSDNPSTNKHLYEKYVERMAECLDTKSMKDKELRNGGYVINTCGWVEKLGYKLIVHAIKAFNANFIISIGDDRLTANLKRDFGSNSNIHIHSISKSGGVVIRNSGQRKKTRLNKIRDYFYGPSLELNPLVIHVSMSDICVCKIGGGTSTPLSALPIGSTTSIDPVKIREVNPSMKMKHHVLGVSFAKTKEEVLNSNICGIVYVQEVDEEKKSLSLLSPSPGKLPYKYLILGNITWIDES